MSSSPNLGVVGVKVVLGTEMRRLNLPSGGDKLAHVASNISRMFPQVQVNVSSEWQTSLVGSPTNQDFKLFYTDDEQDQIRVANDDDLHEALQCQQGGRVLKLTVVPSNEVVQLLASDEAIANVNTSASSSPHHHQADTFTYNQQGQVLHVQVMCDGCGLKPIAGSRFKVCAFFFLFWARMIWLKRRSQVVRCLPRF